MATKKAPAKKAAPVKAPAKAVPAKKQAAAPAPKNVVAAKKMSKTELVRVLAEKLELSSKQLSGFFDQLATMAVDQTRASGEFTIPGIGKLVKVERQARMGRNPQTGEPIQIKAKTDVKFRVTKSIKETIAPPKK